MKSGEVEKQTANVFKNVFYVSGILFRRYPNARWQVPISILCKVIQPFLNTLVPSAAIYCVMKGSVKGLLWSMTGILLPILVVTIIIEWIQPRQDISIVYTRMRHFVYHYIEKTITMDYANVEP